jgi:hypothetical protein
MHGKHTSQGITANPEQFLSQLLTRIRHGHPDSQVATARLQQKLDLRKRLGKHRRENAFGLPCRFVVSN